MNRLPFWLIGALVGSTFLLLVLAELLRPLRSSVEGKLRRDVRNFVIAALSAATVQLAETPLTYPLSERIAEQGWGLVKWLALPVWLEVVLAIVLLDYTFYVWHILLHKVPLLWRCHQPHHVDLDMDTSTAVRFHFAEIAASVPWRIGQIAVIGVSPLALSVWQTGTLMVVMFQHSNVRLPLAVERWVNWLIVTPRMHGIHHSIVGEEQNSNWSSGLTLWDWLHGTLRLNVPQAEITIGVPAFRDPEEVTLPKVVVMPFVGRPRAWQLPSGEVPERQPGAAPRRQMLD
jgi:sterol desaturase/sphingolipid hydroxylase (fatty acid hydroxylase superfamily)